MADVSALTTLSWTVASQTGSLAYKTKLDGDSYTLDMKVAVTGDASYF